MWNIIIADEADSTGERIATATWTKDGKSFTFSKGITITPQGKKEFIQAARQALKTWQAKQDKTVALAAEITETLNKEVQ